MGYHERAVWIARSVAAGFVVALLLTRELWLSSRLYPLTPVAAWLPVIASPFDFAVYVALLASAAAAIVFPRRTTLAVCAGLYFSYSLWDQQRWVPFFNEIGALLLVLCFHRWNSRDAERARAVVDTCGLVVVLIYLWSGIQKIGYAFPHEVGPWMLEPFLPASLMAWAPYLSLPMPVLEIAMGTMLLTLRCRRAGIVIATAMHTFILASAGPLGHDGNVQIWFWNVESVTLVFLIFAGNRASFAEFFRIRGMGIDKAVIGFFGVMPIFNLVVVPGLGKWDDFQAATLYSGNNCTGELYMSDADFMRMPPKLQAIVYELESGENVLLIRDWAYAELNVPDYHAFRIHENVARAYCRLMFGSPTVIFRWGTKSDPLTGERRWTEYRCQDLL